jgi:hypothetical protein
MAKRSKVVILAISIDKSGLKVMSNLAAGFSQVFLASLVIPVFAVQENIVKFPAFLVGILLTLLSCFFAVYFGQKAGI